MSPIATDGVLFQFDKEDFQGAQGFQIPREDVYNVTIAGAAGGRGLCNIHFGHGRIMDFQVQLTPEYELLVMVGQKGKSPCDKYADHLLCHSPPTSLREANHRDQSWYNYTLERSVNHQMYLYTGGAGGGGASMLRARNVETGDILSLPHVVAGGGGGTSAILNYNSTFDLVVQTGEQHLTPEEFYRSHVHIDRLILESRDNYGRRGYRPLSRFSCLSGAGGGWSSQLSTSGTDGKSLSQTTHFAEGGLNCDHLQLLDSAGSFSKCRWRFWWRWW